MDLIKLRRRALRNSFGGRAEALEFQIGKLIVGIGIVISMSGVPKMYCFNKYYCNEWNGKAFMLSLWRLRIGGGRIVGDKL